MAFEWANSGCMRRILRKLIEQNVPVKLTLVKACDNCERGVCQRKHTESSLELTATERRMLDSGKYSVDEILEARKEVLKVAWTKEQKRIVMESEQK